MNSLGSFVKLDFKGVNAQQMSFKGYKCSINKRYVQNIFGIIKFMWYTRY